MTRTIKQLLLFVFILVFFTNTALTQDDMMDMPEPDESGMASVNDIEVYYAVYGEGDPVIFLHGGLGHSDYWAYQISEFAEEYQVIVMDSRGHGRSTVSDEPIGYALMASDVIALMDFLDLESASIVGWSDGGIIGLHIAINNPDSLDMLVAYGANYNISGVRADAEENEDFLAYVDLAVNDYLEMSPNPELLDPFLENISNMWGTEPDFSAEELASITAPVLVLDGWNEEAIITEHTIEMAALIGSAELTFIPDTGHFAMWETADRFNEIILGFFATAG